MDLSLIEERGRLCKNYNKGEMVTVMTQSETELLRSEVCRVPERLDQAGFGRTGLAWLERAGPGGGERTCGVFTTRMKVAKVCRVSHALH